MPSPEQPAPVRTHSVQIQQVQNVYFNGFSLGVSNSDMNALLTLNGQTICHLNMSFTTAKTLHRLIGELVEKFEGATEHEIMTTEEVEEGLKKLATDRNPRV